MPKAWRVKYRVFKNRQGYYENGGDRLFKTYEEAEKFINEFKERESGWTSDIDEPEEVEASEDEFAEIDI